MLYERPKVHFGDTREWTYRNTEFQIESRAVTTYATKEKDGPNQYTRLKYRIIRDYFRNRFTSCEEMKQRYGDNVIQTLGIYLEKDFQDIYHRIKRDTKGVHIRSMSSKKYHLTKEHLPHLECLIQMIHLIILETRIMSFFQ